VLDGYINKAPQPHTPNSTDSPRLPASLGYLHARPLTKHQASGPAQVLPGGIWLVALLIWKQWGYTICVPTGKTCRSLHEKYWNERHLHPKEERSEATPGRDRAKIQ